MRSPLSLGVLFIAMGGLSVGGIGARAPLGPVGYGLAGLLIAGGVALISRRALAFYVALAAAIAAAGTGLLSLAGRPDLALPVPPALSIGVGLYLCLRLFLAKDLLGPRRPAAPSEGP